MNKLLAFAWLVAIGTNGAQYYSQEAPYEAAVILAGTAYFLFAFPRESFGLVFFKDYLLVIAILVIPIVLMLLSDRSFERVNYISEICVVMVFVVATVLALQADFDRPLRTAAFVIVAIGSTLNLYELLVANNTWSISPGRSGGLYVNPNYSSEALLGYGLAFLTGRTGKKLSLADIALMALVVVGVFATFSRSGILATLLLLTAAVVMRVHRKNLIRTVVGAAGVALVAFAFASYVVDNLNLSPDATLRIDSLLDSGGIDHYETDRGAATSAALDLIEQEPVFGAGVRTTNKMSEGPHNMFLAMMVDYGILGVTVYLLFIIRLVLIARQANRHVSGMVLFYVAWLVIFSFVSHNLLGNTATIVLLGFAMARACQIHPSVRRPALSYSFARSIARG